MGLRCSLIPEVLHAIFHSNGSSYSCRKTIESRFPSAGRRKIKKERIGRRKEKQRERENEKKNENQRIKRKGKEEDRKKKEKSRLIFLMWKFEICDKVISESDEYLSDLV